MRATNLRGLVPTFSLNIAATHFLFLHRPTMSTASTAPPASANPLAGGCPVLNKRAATAAAAAAAATTTAGRAEPPDTPDRPLDVAQAAGATDGHMYAKVETKADSSDAGDQIPGSVIPASGRGNSDDGRLWLNPSANQLFRALKRKDKAIDIEDAPAVASVHEMVTDSSWQGIMEFEEMHKDTCCEPTLAKFEGKDGHFTLKSWLMKQAFGVVPFDRHDWTVDRCGKEVRYVIDYYAVPGPHGDTEYFVDARPAGFSGLYDRVRLAARKYQAGEKWW